MSGDSYGSPLLERPSYIATFNANRPRHHRRRSSIPVAHNEPSSLPASASASASSSRSKHVTQPSQQALLRERRRFREHHASTPRSSTEQTGSHSAASAWATRRRASPSPNSSRRTNTNTVSPDSSTDNFYSSTYAAGPSNPDTARGYGAGGSSSDDDDSSADEVANFLPWDTRDRRSSMPVPRAYLSPHDYVRAANGASSSSSPGSSSPHTLLNGPAKRLSAVLNNVAGRSTPPPTPPQPPTLYPQASAAPSFPPTPSSHHNHPNHRPPNLRPESLHVGPSGDTLNGTSITSSARLTPSPRLRESHFSPNSEVTHSARRSHATHQQPPAKQRRSLNATGELALLASLGAWACFQLARIDHEVVQGKVFELATVIVAAIVYFFLAPSPGRIWSTDTRSYRASDDDGSMCGLLLGPLLAATMLIASEQNKSHVAPLDRRSPNGEPLPRPPWLVEAPVVILGDAARARFLNTTSASALTLSRSTLLSLQTLLSLIFLIHIVANKWYTQRAVKRGSPINLQTSGARFTSYVLFALSVTGSLLAAKQAMQHAGLPAWSAMASWELVTASVVFQTSMYSISRLGRRSFTLGELAIVAALGVTLMLETINVTLAKLFPNTTLYLKTFRTASPLLVFQLTLIVGTFLVGFLLSPLLYLSRHLAQKPVHRLRWPHKRDLHRRLLAGFFYFFATAYVLGVLGLWVKWVLGGRDPWFWTLMFTVQGHRWWTRPALIVYWLAWITASIAGWQAVVVRAKRFRNSRQTVARASQPIPTGGAGGGGNGSGGTSGNVQPPRGLGWDLMQTGSALQAAAASRLSSTTAFKGDAEGGSAKDATNGRASSPSAVPAHSSTTAAKVKKSAHLSLNARRKFFHALAVILYTPGIALDPAFMHLAFSLAFSVFTFAEYIRYYALYPFGASLHIFLSEFTDHKDSGPVILSHFYLLTGCCGGLWLEGNKQIIHQTGVLVLGIGDALASVVGRKYGRMHWPKSSKTIEGSAAFLVSVVFSAWVLRLIGWCESFSLWRYSSVVALLCFMEGVSDQNDNLVLPIVAFIALSLAQI